MKTPIDTYRDAWGHYIYKARLFLRNIIPFAYTYNSELSDAICSYWLEKRLHHYLVQPWELSDANQNEALYCRA